MADKPRQSSRSSVLAEQLAHATELLRCVRSVFPDLAEYEDGNGNSLRPLVEQIDRALKRMTESQSDKDRRIRLNVAQGLEDFARYGGNADHSDRKNLLEKAAELLKAPLSSCPPAYDEATIKAREAMTGATPMTDATQSLSSMQARDGWILARQLERELAEVKAGEAKAILENQHLHHENIRLKDVVRTVACGRDCKGPGSEGCVFPRCTRSSTTPAQAQNGGSSTTAPKP